MLELFKIEYTFEVEQEGGEPFWDFGGIYVVAGSIAKAVAAFEKEKPEAKINIIEVRRNVIIAYF